MNFRLTEEHEMIRKVVRDFAIKEVEPTAGERDEEERFDREIFKKMGELGLTGIPWPEDYGGLGGDFLTYVMVIEELSRICASTGAALSAHIAQAGWPLYKFGSEEQKHKFLKPMAQGKKLGTCGIIQSHSGSDQGGMGTIAECDGNEYILNGSNPFVMNAGEAEVYVVFALTDPRKNSKRCSAFIVEKGIPGFSVGKKMKKLGIRSSATQEIIFDHCRVSKENLLGKQGEGFTIAMMTLDSGHMSAAARAIGIAQGALDASTAYAKERKQFGKPIGHQQGIAFKLADMATKIEAARLLTYQAAWCKDEGLSYGKESAIAKLFSGDTAMDVTIEAVQVFGGYGYMRDYPMERYMRDAKCTQMNEGTNEMQRVAILHMLAD